MTIVNELRPLNHNCRCCMGSTSEIARDLCEPCWDALFDGRVPHNDIHQAAHSQLVYWGVLYKDPIQPFRG